jgi:hypothetical protein
MEPERREPWVFVSFVALMVREGDVERELAFQDDRVTR